MARPVVVPRRASSAPADVRTKPRAGTVSSAAARARKTARASDGVGGANGLFGGLPSIDFSNFVINLPPGFQLMDSYTSPTNGTAPTVPTQQGQNLFVRSAATVSQSSGERVAYSFPVSPNEVNVSRVGIGYTEIGRPGRKPILKSANKPLQQISATVIVVNGNKDYLSSATPQMKALEALAELDYDLEVFYPGVDPAKKWRLTDLSFRTVRRNENNEVAIAEASLTFTEVMTLPAPVPGMPRLKDVPSARKNNQNPGATTPDQRDDSLDDAIKKILLAGPTPNNPGTTGGGS